jgi:hypothetical protein
MRVRYEDSTIGRFNTSPESGGAEAAIDWSPEIPWHGCCTGPIEGSETESG